MAVNPFTGSANSASSAVSSATDALKGVGSALASIAEAGSTVINLIPGLSQLQQAFAGFGAAIRSSVSDAISQLGSLVQSVTGSVKSFIALNQTAYAVATAMDKVGGALKATAGAAVSLWNAGSQALSAVNGVAMGMAKFGSEAAKAGTALLRLPLDILETAVSSIQMQVARFVKLANPAEFQRFQLAVDDLYASIGRALTPVLQAATDLFRSLGGALFGLNESGQRAIQALAAGTAAMLTFAAAAVALQTVLSGGVLPVVFAVIGGMSGLIAASDAFRPALQSIGKVVGGILESFGEALTQLLPAAQPIIDLIGDIGRIIAATIASYSSLFASLAPQIGALTAAFGVIREAFVKVVEAVQGVSIEIVSSAIRTLADVMEMAAPYVAAFAKVVGQLVSDLIKWVASLFGLTLPTFTAPGSTPANNVGAAARSTSTGSVDDVLRKARESAFSLGTGANSAASTTATNTTAINQAIQQQQAKIDQIVASINSVVNDVKEFPGKVATAIGNAADYVVEGITNALDAINPVPGVSGGVGSAVRNQVNNIARALGAPTP